MARVRVIRTLVVEGDEQWVIQTLGGSFIQPDRPFLLQLEPDDARVNSIRESRTIPEVIEEQEPDDGNS